MHPGSNAKKERTGQEWNARETGIRRAECGKKKEEEQRRPSPPFNGRNDLCPFRSTYGPGSWP
jgi:hypothetical protein